jgi:hypothetical protein
MLNEVGERSLGMVRIFGAWFAVLVAAACLVGPGFAQELDGKGSVGASGGLVLLTGDEDLSRDAQPRLLGHFDLRYVISPRLAVHGTFGRGWNSYYGRADTLTIIEPFTMGVEYRHVMEQWPRYLPHVGAGIGVYSMRVREHLQVTHDLKTLERRHFIDWGVNVTAGLEYFITRNVTVNYDFVWHKIFSENMNDFPEGFGGDDSFVQFVIGANYYFSLDILDGDGE